MEEYLVANQAKCPDVDLACILFIPEYLGSHEWDGTHHLLIRLLLSSEPEVTDLENSLLHSFYNFCRNENILRFKIAMRNVHVLQILQSDNETVQYIHDLRLA